MGVELVRSAPRIAVARASTYASSVRVLEWKSRRIVSKVVVAGDAGSYAYGQ